MNMKRELLIAAAGAALLLTGCDVKDSIYDTAHPEQGKITLTTDWTNRTDGISVPANYTVQMGDYSATISGATNTLNRLFDPGDYRLYVYNTADHIVVSGTTATVDYSGGTLGWFFSSAQDVSIAKDADHAFTAVMKQQVRQLTLVIEPTGGTTDRIAGITATLSGTAGTLDFDSDTHGAPSNVVLEFTKITSGADAGKWMATVRLLGVIGAEQKLSGTISFTGGEPADLPLDSDLTSALTGFNADKKTPLTLGGTAVETPIESGFTATINSWVIITGNGTAD